MSAEVSKERREESGATGSNLSGSPGGHCSAREVSVPWGSSSLSHQNVKGCEVTHKIPFSIHGKYHWCGFMLLTHGISCLRLWLCSLVVVILFCFSFFFFLF